LPLPGGQILRVATAEAILPEQGSHFQQGLVPDLPVALSEREKREIFQKA
jgi:C-terminal processing protease CtpA/Prc